MNNRSYAVKITDRDGVVIYLDVVHAKTKEKAIDKACESAGVSKKEHGIEIKELR